MHKHGVIRSFHWQVQNATIPRRSQELLPFLSVTCFFLPPLHHQLFFHPLSLHLAIYFLVYLCLVVPKFIYIYNTLLGILFPSILCACPNQRNLFDLTVCLSPLQYKHGVIFIQNSWRQNRLGGRQFVPLHNILEYCNVVLWGCRKLSLSLY